MLQLFDRVAECCQVGTNDRATKRKFFTKNGAKKKNRWRQADLPPQNNRRVKVWWSVFLWTRPQTGAHYPVFFFLVGLFSASSQDKTSLKTGPLFFFFYQMLPYLYPAQNFLGTRHHLFFSLGAPVMTRASAPTLAINGHAVVFLISKIAFKNQRNMLVAVTYTRDFPAAWGCRRSSCSQQRPPRCLVQ